jgi:two-component system, NtrC family, sensor histidine kinase PilS
MPSLNEKNPTANESFIRSARNLIFGRLIVVLVLFGVSWIWYGGAPATSSSGIPGGPIAIFLVSVVATVLYFAFLRSGWLLEWQIWLQLVVDAVLITWLVALTGELSSPFITLYIVLISISSLFLRPLATLFVALIAVSLLMFLGLMPALGLIETASSQYDIRRVVEVISFHVVAFLVVGLLAARLSERRSSGDELKETAKSLASLRALHERIVESIKSGLITTDLDGTVYSANAAAVEITGISSDELKGRSIFSIFPEMETAVQLTLDATTRSEQIPRFETDLITPEGFAVHIGYNISYLYSENHEQSGLIITFQDLTEIRSMEESVRRKDRLAAVGRIGAGLAHEIRNPLGAMRGAIQVLESTTPAESIQADLMGIILRESDRLNSIITSFLNYAKPKAGDFTEIDICEALRETTKLLRHSPDIKPDHTVEEELPPNPVFISADVTQLKQIFWNLARNAVHAMPEGGTLTIRLSKIPNNRVRIVFSDTGVGMPPERVEQLFEPFANSTTGGTGLGLSIVYQIIRDHNGTINVRSAEGEGTVITVDLPVENVQSADRPGAKQSAAAKTTSPLGAYLNVKNDQTEVSS